MEGEVIGKEITEGVHNKDYLVMFLRFSFFLYLGLLLVL